MHTPLAILSHRQIVQGPGRVWILFDHLPQHHGRLLRTSRVQQVATIDAP